MSEKMKITEYCLLKSKTDRRIELLSGFEFYIKHMVKQPIMTAEDFDKEFGKYLKIPA
jgi:hypothetical protein